MSEQPDVDPGEVDTLDVAVAELRPALEAILMVSDQPVAPSFGFTLATGVPSATARFWMTDIGSSSAARCCASSRVRLGGATIHLSCSVLTILFIASNHPWAGFAGRRTAHSPAHGYSKMSTNEVR